MKKLLSPFTIAAIYIGTIVGAGFATGQELLQFFGFFGRWGLAGLILSSLLFIVYGYAVLELGRKLQAQSHLAIVHHVGGKWFGTAIDLIVTFFLFGALTTMAAGAGAVLTEEFGLSSLWGSMAMVVVTAITVLLGLKGVVAAVSFVVPFLLLAVLGVSLAAVTLRYPNLAANLRFFLQGDAAPVPFWPLTALLYVSYNLVLAIPIMGPLGTLARPRQLRLGAILGGLGLGLAALAINLSILANIPETLAFEVPMLFVAGSISPFLRLAFSLVLLAEVYTTAVTSLYGFIARVTKPTGPFYSWAVIGFSSLAFVGAQFGFSNIVATLFPAVGVAGLLLLATLTYGMWLDFRGRSLPHAKPGEFPPGPEPLWAEFAAELVPEEQERTGEKSGEE